jgi:hypothetical protein
MKSILWEGRIKINMKSNETINQDLETRMREIDIKLEENAVKQEQYIMGYDNIDEEEYLTLKEEEQELKEEKKAIKKTIKLSRPKKWYEEISALAYVYAIIQIIVSSRLVMPYLTSFLTDIIFPALGDQANTNFGAFVIILGPLLLSLLITIIIFLSMLPFKNKRKAWAVILVLHTLSALTSVFVLIKIYNQVI